MTTLEPIRRRSDTAMFPATWPSMNRAATPSTVLEAVQSMNEADLKPVAPVSAGVAFRPRTLLAFLTYYYARGIYGSQEIETIMRQDVTFRIVCGNEFPDSQTLRRFRRYNRDAICQCLARVFRQIGRGSAGTRTHSTGTGGTETAPTAARHCVEEAMFVDGMAGD